MIKWQQLSNLVYVYKRSVVFDFTPLIWLTCTSILWTIAISLLSSYYTMILQVATLWAYFKLDCLLFINFVNVNWLQAVKKETIPRL